MHNANTQSRKVNQIDNIQRIWAKQGTTKGIKHCNIQRMWPKQGLKKEP